MRALCEKFTNPRLPDEVFGFAVTYLKRFYLHHSVMDFYPREMMLTCLYMACKAADFPVGIQTFTSHIPRNQERYSYFILNSELFLLEALGYDLWVFTPYRPLTGLIMDLVAYQKRLRKNSSGTQVSLNEVELVNELRKEGTELINLWYQTDLCLTVHPSQFALAILVELGRTRPQLDVEVFVRDELCGCDPMQKPKKLSVSSSNGQDTEEEDEDEDDDNSDDENAAKINSKGPVNKQEEVKKRSSSPQPKSQKNDHIPPEERWKQLSERLDHIRAVVNEFDFVYNLQRITEEETKLEACRNPLYDLDSDEYKEAKSKADSLLANLE
ncbi:putative cyclin-H [Fasciola gigantica]|uniref:Putative cyclin-H n=1 Tax=Fasciola gigantica TaxID=46835 RepID=A0A504YIV9_FASGI|nr:putative cyclin-H [Fasciola gigantica]